jgi:type IV fimbrial biogenesis protein FimT
MRIHHCRAFTWMELIIAIVVLAILATLALPSFQQDLMKKEVQHSQLKLSRAIQLARQHAMSQANHVVLCGSNNQKSCINNSWSDGFLVFIDINNNRKVDANENVILSESLNLKYGTLNWGSLNNNNLSFIPRTGLPLGSNGTFSYCSRDQKFNYSLVISQMGHSRIDQTQKCT